MLRHWRTFFDKGWQEYDAQTRARTGESSARDRADRAVKYRPSVDCFADTGGRQERIFAAAEF